MQEAVCLLGFMVLLALPSPSSVYSHSPVFRVIPPFYSIPGPGYSWLSLCIIHPHFVYCSKFGAVQSLVI